MAAWRAMTAEDVAFVAELGLAIYPHLPESVGSFAAKFAATPEACRVACDRDGSRVGYCVALWAELGRPPKLDDVAYAPCARECLHLHDLAVAPAARGQGLVAQAVAHLRGVAGALPLTLVAVNGSAPLWRRFGFSEVAGSAASYGADALYMRRNP
ncbi:MAG: GNAT family N-acetyltransferase [Telmatospirillum sp.]|nr:GNAT family N-acetyltransferase [Telmatospirillum sp.]